MARKLRVQYPGAIYHVMNRGDRREPIFTDDDDRLLYLATLGEACEKTDWQVHAWCLLSNHFHLVVETPHGNLGDGMQWFLGVYTNRFNHRKAERIIREELEALGWNADDLRRHRKSHASKVRIAARLRRETTMTLDWIADQLCMGSAGHVSHLFYRNKAKPTKANGEESQKKLF